MSLSAVKYQDGIEISFSPQCKHFHLLQASEGRGSHICDRSIGPNALGRAAVVTSGPLITGRAVRSTPHGSQRFTWELAAIDV